MARPSRLLWVLPVVGAAIWSQPTTALAASPYPVNVHVVTHQAVEFDPNFLFDAAPCFVAVGDLTEVFNAEGHALAAGIDDQGNFVPPLHVQQNVEESILFDPYDAALPTYTGHATVHTTNTEDSPRRLRQHGDPSLHGRLAAAVPSGHARPGEGNGRRVLGRSPARALLARHRWADEARRTP
jgi:hypothetical protein